MHINQHQYFFGFIPGQAAPREQKPPRQENLWDFFRYTFCPHLRLLSATVLIVTANALVFALLVSHTVVTTGELTPYFLVGIQPSTLQTFGMRSPWLIYYHGQAFRFLAPSVLHVGLRHCVVNSVLMAGLGAVVESAIGSLFMLAFYVSVVFGSNLFGAVCSPELSAVGSDPVLYALLTAILLLLTFNWPHMPGPPTSKILRFFAMAIVVMIIVFLLSQQASTAGAAWLLLSEQIRYPDLYGSLGGVAYGAVASLCILPAVTRRSDLAGGIAQS